jgi:hypothetical protein
MKKAGLVFVVLFVVVISGACISRVADFTLLASKNISTLEGAQKMGVFEGKDCKNPLGGAMPNQEEALDIAVEAGGGNAMVDAVVYFKPAVCILDSNCFTVKGTVIKTKEMFGSDATHEHFKAAETHYIKETLTSPSGHKYLAFRNRSTVELDHDKKHYDLIVRIK